MGEDQPERRKYKDVAELIPWSSFGRETIASKVGLSLLPIGIYNFDLPKAQAGKPPPAVDSSDINFEKYLINIVGTAIQAGEGKLVTCLHVVDAVDKSKKKGYVLLNNRTSPSELARIIHGGP